MVYTRKLFTRHGAKEFATKHHATKKSSSFVISFSPLGVEDLTDDNESDNEPQDDTPARPAIPLCIKQPKKSVAESKWDEQVAVFCLLEDMAEIRAFVLRCWQRVRDGEICVSSAASITDMALEILGDMSTKFTNLHPHITSADRLLEAIDFLPSMARKTDNTNAWWHVPKKDNRPFLLNSQHNIDLLAPYGYRALLQLRLPQLDIGVDDGFMRCLKLKPAAATRAPLEKFNMALEYFVTARKEALIWLPGAFELWRDIYHLMSPFRKLVLSTLEEDLRLSKQDAETIRHNEEMPCMIKEHFGLDGGFLDELFTYISLGTDRKWLQ